jgi:hypothetical protein
MQLSGSYHTVHSPGLCRGRPMMTAPGLIDLIYHTCRSPGYLPLIVQLCTLGPNLAQPKTVLGRHKARPHSKTLLVP